MNWIKEHQATSIRSIAIVIIISSISLIILTTLSFKLAALTQGKNVLLLGILFYLPLTIIPLLVGFISKMFLQKQNNYLMYITAFVSYVYFALTETFRAISQNDTSKLFFTWLYVPLLVLIVGSFILLGAYISKKAVKID